MAEYLTFGDLNETEHDTMVFELSESGESGDRYVKLAEEVASIAIPDGPIRHVSGISRMMGAGRDIARGKQTTVVRALICNAISLRSGALTNFPRETLILPIKHVVSGDNDGHCEQCSCEEDDEEGE